MSDSIIKIDPQKVFDSGNKIISFSKELLKNLETASQAVKTTETCYQSKAGDDLRGKIAKANVKFEEFEKAVAGYGSFLEKYAEQHRLMVEKEQEIISQLKAL